MPRHPFDMFAEVPDQAWLAKLLQRPDPRAAAAVLERTLARLAPRVPSASDVAGIYRHYRISPRCARSISIALLDRMLQHCQRNDVAPADELHYLDALRVALELQEGDVAGIREGETSSTLRPGCRERTFNSAVVTPRTSSPRHVIQAER